MAVTDVDTEPTVDRTREEDTVSATVTTGEGPAVRAEGMSVYYGEEAGLESVSLEVQPGLITAIIGPSGCGKSTFLRAINRMNDLIPHCRAEGTLEVEGRDVNEPDTDVVALRQKVGMVFQEPNPFPKTIFDNVAYGPRLRGRVSEGELEELVQDSLRRAALWDEVKDRLNHNAMDLSGGQQQRLCIARALAVDPDILLMDEPCSALDPNAMNRIENLLSDLRGDYTILIVTHNMQQAARVSDETAFLYEGELIESGPTDRLFTNPREEVTEAYITGRFG